VDFTPIDWAKVADGFGVRAERISSEAELERALAEAMVASGPVLIDVPIDARTHLPTLRAIRG
jgi:thiamine pyrophosphate-dependent acetolactate synthase large subunit-like protein